MSYTDHVELQCGDINIVQGGINEAENEFSNIETHLEDAKSKLEQITELDVTEYDIDEVIEWATEAASEIDDAETDRSDGDGQLTGLCDTLENIRHACSQLRSAAEHAAESESNHVYEMIYEELGDMDADDAKSKMDQQEEDINEKDEQIEQLTKRINELERLLDPMLPIPFKTPGLKELEQWEQSSSSSSSSSQ